MRFAAISCDNFEQTQRETLKSICPRVLLENASATPDIPTPFFAVTIITSARLTSPPRTSPNLQRCSCQRTRTPTRLPARRLLERPRPFSFSTEVLSGTRRDHTRAKDKTSIPRILPTTTRVDREKDHDPRVSWGLSTRPSFCTQGRQTPYQPTSSPTDTTEIGSPSPRAPSVGKDDDRTPTQPLTELTIPSSTTQQIERAQT